MPEITYGSAFDLEHYIPKINWGIITEEARRSRVASEAVTEGKVSTTAETVGALRFARNVHQINSGILKGKRTAEQERKRKAASKAARAQGRSMTAERI